MKHIDHFITSAIDWIFRRRSPGLSMVRWGVALLSVLLAGFVISFNIPSAYGQWFFKLDTNAATPAWLTIGAAIASLALIIGGLRRIGQESRAIERKRVLVIEMRGLRDSPGASLLAAVPSELEGRRDLMLIDLRQRVADGVIVDPRAALQRLVSLPSDLDTRIQDIDRRDLSIVFGGLAPVPFTFLAGVFLDDETSLEILDWDRHNACWRRLDAADDGKRFQITGLDSIADATSVAVAVSVSYLVDLSGVRKALPTVPLIHLKLEDGLPDAHWSGAKQSALAKQFLETIVSISNAGVREIHLFLAAQSSVVLRFGRTYDKRNLPSVTVHQYERGADPPYPWAVEMPVSGVQQPRIAES